MAAGRRNPYLYVEAFGYDEKQLKDLVAGFGHTSILEVKSTVDNNGQVMTIGFVSYESHEDAARAAEELKGKVAYIFSLQDLMACMQHLLQGQHLSPGPGVTVRVTNLDDDLDEEKLGKEFSKFGTITSVKVCWV